MPIDLPIPQSIADDTNYAAGVFPWSGNPTKIAPGSSMKTKGWIPGQPIPAEEENYIKVAIRDLAYDALGRSIKQIDAGAVDSYSLGWYLEKTKRLFAGYQTGGSNKATVFAPNNPTRLAATATVLASFQDRFAYDRTDKKLLCFAAPLIGNTGTGQTASDVKACTMGTFTPPTVNARYTDACTDAGTGKPVLVSALDPGTPAFGLAYGSPATALSWTAAPIGWVSDATTKIASRVNQANAVETRVFSVARTYATSDGGATTTACNNTTWSGGLAANSTMYRPTYDRRNDRWICQTADMTVSHDGASSTSKLWTSTNGITWTTLATNPSFVFLDMLYHRGWLWAIGCVLDRTGDAGHGGLEVFWSRDGGTTWVRTGWILSLRTGGTVTDHVARIIPCDGVLVFSTYRATAAAGDFEYITVDVGNL